ncbi:hypothetical protein, partial [Mesorhizobium sp.]|uniref:hypothetical protein n=1 Tax=Mesorhizobium sp. TaxID=1871066 RepID=UPI00338FAD56
MVAADPRSSRHQAVATSRCGAVRHASRDRSCRSRSRNRPFGRNAGDCRRRRWAMRRARRQCHARRRRLSQSRHRDHRGNLVAGTGGRRLLAHHDLANRRWLFPRGRAAGGCLFRQLVRRHVCRR